MSKTCDNCTHSTSIDPKCGLCCGPTAKQTKWIQHEAAAPQPQPAQPQPEQPSVQHGLFKEAALLAGILSGMVEGGYIDLETLYTDDQVDGDAFVKRAAEVLTLFAQPQPVQDARLQELRWLLEELRVSFFVQPLRVGGIFDCPGCRLEAANAELLEALVDLVALYPLDSTDAIITSARAAISAKKGGA